MDSQINSNKHIGRQISRIRELRGMKQEALAIAMNVSQQRISSIENSYTIEDKKLEEVAKALNVTKETIINFSNELVLNILSNFFKNADHLSDETIHLQSNFNPMDRIAELYERLLKAEKEVIKAEKEKVAYLEKLLSNQ